MGLNVEIYPIMKNLWIFGLPLPPSVNSMYETNITRFKSTKDGVSKMNVRVNGKRRSKALKAFQERCELMKRQNPETFKKYASTCKEWINQGFQLSMDSYCVFYVERLFTKDQKVQAIDADNFRKALQDAVFRILEIDDKYVFCGNIEKVSCINKDLECSIVSLKPVRARNLTEIRNLVSSPHT